MTPDEAMALLPDDPAELKRMVIFWCQRTVTPVDRFVVLWENGYRLAAMLKTQTATQLVSTDRDMEGIDE